MILTKNILMKNLPKQDCLRTSLTFELNSYVIGTQLTAYNCFIVLNVSTHHVSCLEYDIPAKYNVTNYEKCRP